MKEIGKPNELKQIVHIGSKLYSTLSQLSRQSFLLLADLPFYLYNKLSYACILIDSHL